MKGLLFGEDGRLSAILNSYSEVFFCAVGAPAR